MRMFVVALAGLFMGSVVVACSSSTDAIEARDDVAAAATPEAVSFAADVAPIFERSCSFSSCHASASSGNHGVYLGARGFAKDATARSAVQRGLVAKASTAQPSWRLVVAGDPEASWLVRKIEGSFEGACTSSCGERMPKGGDALSAAERGAIRAWVAAGAKDD